MHEAEKLSLGQIEAFLNASEEIRFEGENRQQVYAWVEQVLRQQQYAKPGRKARGLLRRYIHAEHTERIQQFYSAHLNPYLNYHRPCAQADLEVDEKGRQRRYYRRYQTPLETLLALSPPAPALRQGLTLAVLQRIAAAVSDTEAAQRMQQAKVKLFEQLRQPAGFAQK